MQPHDQHGPDIPILVDRQQEYSKPKGTMASILEASGPPRDLGKVLGESFLWYDRIGVGWYPVKTGNKPYDSAYFERFRRQADSEIGRNLMRARVEFVARHHRGQLCDIGIGSGAFIEARQNRQQITFGWDVCRDAIEWLDSRSILVDPNLVPFPALSMWDVLEHIPDFSRTLENSTEWFFASLPIFKGPMHALHSKHFRTDEHCWYFTRDGLVFVMDAFGFDLAEENSEEVAIGREDIGSFAFKRKPNLQ